MINSLVNLKQCILSNNIPNFIIFNVHEPTLAKQYITSISATTGLQYRYFSDAETVLYNVSTNIYDRCVYVLYNDKSLLDKPDKIKQLEGIKGNYIIVYFDDLDTSKLSTYNDYIVAFDRIDTNTLYAYALKILKNNNIVLDESRIFKLIEYCNNDLGKVLNEVDKIVCLGQGDSNLLFDYMMNNGFPDYRQVSLQSFINKILKKDKTALDDVIKMTDSVVSIYYALYYNAKKAFTSTNNPYYYSIMKICNDMYSGVVDGTIGSNYALKYSLLRIFMQ